jgi:hypothetical protein
MKKLVILIVTLTWALTSNAQVKTDTLTLIEGCRSMRAACSVAFINKEENKILANGIQFDSCQTNYGSRYMWNGDGYSPYQIKPEFRYRKFIITYSISDSITEEASGKIYPGIKITRMVLIKN